jgi:hypothetical protein
LKVQLHVSKNGEVFEEYKDALFEGFVKAKKNPQGKELKEELKILFAPIPLSMTTTALAWHRWCYEEHKAEGMLLLAYNEKKKKWKLVCPIQYCSAAHVCYHPVLEEKADPDFTVMGDWHSHPKMGSSGHSSTDHGDEDKNKCGLYIVTKDFTLMSCDPNVVAMVRGQRFSISPELVFDDTGSKGKYTFPEEWKERFHEGTCKICEEAKKAKEEASKSTTTSGSRSGGFSSTRYPSAHYPHSGYYSEADMDWWRRRICDMNTTPTEEERKEIVEAFCKAPGDEIMKVWDEWDRSPTFYKEQEGQIFECEHCKKGFDRVVCPECKKSNSASVVFQGVADMVDYARGFLEYDSDEKETKEEDGKEKKEETKDDDKDSSPIVLMTPHCSKTCSMRHKKHYHYRPGIGRVAAGPEVEKKEDLEDTQLIGVDDMPPDDDDPEVLDMEEEFWKQAYGPEAQERFQY